MTNREIGLVWMADILGRLYEAWPAATDVDPLVVIADTNTDSPPGDTDFELWGHLGTWLAIEGIIRAGDGYIGSAYLHDAVLTAKGFEVLGKPVPGSEKTLGKRLSELSQEVGKEAIKEGSKKAAAEAAVGLVGTFLGSFTKGTL